MTLTIFTPTYNRAYCLEKLYNSLLKQTDQDFIWLVIDDGSSDDTAEIIERFRQQGKINIQYIAQKNGGKHMATNRALDECKTELFVCVDSDDYLTPFAVKTILITYSKVKDRGVLGIYFRKVYEDGTDCASAYPPGVETVGLTDLYHRYHFSGDTMIVLHRALIGNIRFPVFEGEHFVTERVLYNMLNAIAPMYLSDERIYVCEYMADGYTRNAKRLALSNPYGTAVGFLSEAHYTVRPLAKIKNYAQYDTFVRLFDLDVGRIRLEVHPQAYVRFLGRFLSKIHYMGLYRRIKMEFSKNDP